MVDSFANSHFSVRQAGVCTADAITSIQAARREVVESLLDTDQQLFVSFFERFGKELSVRRSVFLRRELQELLSSPLDLIHYSTVIMRLKAESHETLSEHDGLFVEREIQNIFNKYNY